MFYKRTVNDVFFYLLMELDNINNSIIIKNTTNKQLLKDASLLGGLAVSKI